MSEPTLPTQKFVDIRDIKDGVIYLKSGGLRQILMVGGINFDLKSEAEQNLILNTFQSFLNTLDFSVQFFIHSRKINIDAYLKKMAERQEQETNELLKIQISDYIEFIRIFVEENAIISKNFFVVVPYDVAPLNIQSKGLFGFFKKNKVQPQTTLEQNLEQLRHRVNQVTDGLELIGLRVAALETDEIIELFYNLYNPQLVEKKGVAISQ